ncbi:hypothetical protein T484DRAFT_1763704 [Baffinella frigidus]|nr:hypothetical protein T484DRAFT_1763704 [Cryptophyta sp. CCMP2293]
MAAHQCWQCGVEGTEEAHLLRCGGCTAAAYCNRTCQKAAWKAGHKREVAFVADPIAAGELSPELRRAAILDEEGDYMEALAVLAGLLFQQSRTLPRDHVDVARTMRAVGVVRFHDKGWARAVGMMSDASSMWLRLTGERSTMLGAWTEAAKQLEVWGKIEEMMEGIFEKRTRETLEEAGACLGGCFGNVPFFFVLARFDELMGAQRAIFAASKRGVPSKEVANCLQVMGELHNGRAQAGDFALAAQYWNQAADELARCGADDSLRAAGG